MEDYLEVLRKEFEGDDSAFLVQIRIDLEWNKESFSRLVTAMEACCEHDCDKELLSENCVPLQSASSVDILETWSAGRESASVESVAVGGSICKGATEAHPDGVKTCVLSVKRSDLKLIVPDL